MSSPDPISPESAALTAALRAIRRKRGIKINDLAAAMGLPPRTYQQFEAGRSHLDLVQRIQAFALATDSDPYGLILAMALKSPEIAIRSMDNKFVSVMVVALRRFDDRLGDNVARIEVGRLIAAFRKAFEDLESDLAQREAEAAAWLGERKGNE